MTSSEQRKAAEHARLEATRAEPESRRRFEDRLRRIRNWVFRDSGGGASRPYPKK